MTFPLNAESGESESSVSDLEKLAQIVVAQWTVRRLACMETYERSSIRSIARGVRSMFHQTSTINYPTISSHGTVGIRPKSCRPME